MKKQETKTTRKEPLVFDKRILVKTKYGRRYESIKSPH